MVVRRLGRWRRVRGGPDWTVRDDVRSKLRPSIKRLLVKYKYPSDKQPKAIKLVIEQMEAMAPRYVAALRT